MFDRSQYDIDLSDYKVVWAGFWPILIPSTFTLEQEKYLLASQKTLLLNNSSVDNVLKNWMTNFEKNRLSHKPDEKLKLIDDILLFAKNSTMDIFSRLELLNFHVETNSSFANESTFLRLKSTFNSINYHVKFGYLFETFAILKLLLEQLAYAYSCSQIEADEINDFKQPRKSLNKLKEIFPNIGRLYGELNEYSHMEIKRIGEYLEIKDNQSFVMQQSANFSLLSSLYYLQLIKCLNVVFEICFINYLGDFKYIRVDSESREISKDYNKVEELTLNELSKKINELLLVSD